MDSDLLKELMATLAGARAALVSAVSRVSADDWALKDTMVCTIKDIDDIGLKAKKRWVLDKHRS
jgi:hypothetical protein